MKQVLEDRPQLLPHSFQDFNPLLVPDSLCTDSLCIIKKGSKGGKDYFSLQLTLRLTFLYIRECGSFLITERQADVVPVMPSIVILKSVDDITDDLETHQRFISIELALHSVTHQMNTSLLCFCYPEKDSEKYGTQENQRRNKTMK